MLWQTIILTRERTIVRVLCQRIHPGQQARRKAQRKQCHVLYRLVRDERPAGKLKCRRLVSPSSSEEQPKHIGGQEWQPGDDEEPMMCETHAADKRRQPQPPPDYLGFGRSGCVWVGARLDQVGQPGQQRRQQRIDLGDCCCVPQARRKPQRQRANRRGGHRANDAPRQEKEQEPSCEDVSDRASAYAIGRSRFLNGLIVCPAHSGFLRYPERDSAYLTIEGTRPTFERAIALLWIYCFGSLLKLVLSRLCTKNVRG